MVPAIAMTLAAVSVPVLTSACRVTAIAAFWSWGTPPRNGICAIHDSGPIADRTFPIEMLRNALTIRGSK